LTQKQKLFVKNYLIHFNATRAAIDAGYAESGARVEGTRLLANANIKQAVQPHIDAIVKQTDDKRAYLIRFWQQMIDNPTTSEQARVKCSDLMGKYLSMFTERLELSGGIKVVYLDKDDEKL